MTLKDLLVLYVFDENASDNIVLPILKKNLYKVYTANTISEAKKKYKNFSPCIIVLDDNFKERNSITFLEEIRKNDIKTAFIILTNNNSNKYLFDLIELYITKYITKPFKEEDFMSSLNKCLEMIKNRINSNIKLGNGFLFNFQTQSIIKDGEVVVLNKKESILINVLIQNQNRIITYEELEYHIWDDESTTAALKSLIRDFRRKTYKTILKNYSGIGYKLNIAS